jgi:threonine dehydrogenase-like Zn-dependent dehydrogenase
LKNESAADSQRTMRGKMRALVLDPTQGLLMVDDFPIPSPGPDEALVKVLLGGICATDLALVAGYKQTKERLILGHEFCGLVQEVGARVADPPSWTGRRVCGEINISAACAKSCAICALGDAVLARNHCQNRAVLGILTHHGAFAEYLVLPVANLHLVPDSLCSERALFAEPVAAAFRILEQLPDLRPGAALVIGDGKLAALVCQVLRLSSLSSVTMLCKHPERVRLMSQVCACVMHAEAGAYSVVVEATGTPGGLRDALKYVRAGGTVVLKSTCAPQVGGGVSTDDLNGIVVREVCVLGSRCGPMDRALKALAEDSIAVDFLVAKTFRLEQGLAAMEFARGNLKVLVEM